MEAARWWGSYTLSGWMREEPIHRARITAHYLHMTMRESYISEKMMKGIDKAKPGATPGSVLAHLGI